MNAGNLLDYVSWRGDLPRNLYPYNEIDWMVFARLTYAPFRYICMSEEKEALTLKELMEELLSRPDLEELVLRKMDLSFFEILKDSIRYNDARIGNYVDIIDSERELQFCAYTVELPGGPAGVLFKGTDDTVIGWKENMNMSFQCPVEAQNMAAKFFNRFADTHRGDFVLAGHSKGGNLAAYAASFCNYEYQDRILAVYNYDGPGFDDMVLVTPQYQNICSRIHTFVPQTSMVGILLGHMEEYQVVHSTQNNIMGQHNMYTWEIERNHFVFEETTTAGSKYFDETMRDWLARMDKQTREEFVDTVYELSVQMNIHSFTELKRKWLPTSISLITTFRGMDDEKRKIILEGLAILMKSAKENLIGNDREDNEIIDEVKEIGTEEGREKIPLIGEIPEFHLPIFRRKNNGSENNSREEGSSENNSREEGGSGNNSREEGCSGNNCGSEEGSSENNSGCEDCEKNDKNEENDD